MKADQANPSRNRGHLMPSATLIADAPDRQRGRCGGPNLRVVRAAGSGGLFALCRPGGVPHGHLRRSSDVAGRRRQGRDLPLQRRAGGHVCGVHRPRPERQQAGGHQLRRPADRAVGGVQQCTAEPARAALRRGPRSRWPPMPSKWSSTSRWPNERHHCSRAPYGPWAMVTGASEGIGEAFADTWQHKACTWCWWRAAIRLLAALAELRDRRTACSAA
jgi:hypothetical protein